jgi:4-hydroxythreonine-4-phosphate dehydrogenase
MSRNNSIKVGITIGDVAGIGPEVIIKTFLDERIFKHCTPVLFANPKVIGFYKKSIEFENLRYSTIKDFSHLSANTLNISLAWENEFEIIPGKPDQASGKAALASLEAAVAALKEKQIDILVTAPINKHVIQNESFKYPGHTQYLQEQFGEKDSLMFMISDDLKIGVVCDHVPIQKVPEKIKTQTILSKLKLMDESLRVDFGIERPKIAVLGLNPHAGDNNLIGTEESEIIIPAIAEAKKSGILVTGPYAADGFFGSCKYLAFDAILAMYHDQGLIPFKFLAQDGVNYTAGLPIVRTSPDHGTAEDIAGKNKASEESFRSAIYKAIDIYESQLAHKEMHSNTLEIKPFKSKR